VRQCVARIDAANAGFARQFEALDYEEELCCVLFSHKNKLDIWAANLTLNCWLAAENKDLRHQADLPGFPDRIVECTLRYSRSLSAATAYFTSTIVGIHKEFVHSRERQLVHLALRVWRWCAHCRLYVIGASISGDGIDTKHVGCHHWVLGCTNIQVGIGKYVHVEDKSVYSQWCLANYVDDGIVNPPGIPVGVRDETSVAIGGELGVHSIGRLEGYCWYGEQFSAT